VTVVIDPRNLTRNQQKRLQRKKAFGELAEELAADEFGEPIEWWQVHVRAWERDDGRTVLRAHWEPEPTEHPRA
jgi:hypothetical protein